ncbi:hypothetical protein RHIZ404_180054 [Rhizobium sp. EC-SD404]|nr:hypothetical protein RHIZ404_180054 [Rhizobium sp. EC-SD404]
MTAKDAGLAFGRWFQHLKLHTELDYLSRQAIVIEYAFAWARRRIEYSGYRCPEGANRIAAHLILWW